MEAVVGFIGVAVGVARGDGGAGDVVGIVAVDGAFELVVPGLWEGVGDGGGVDGGLVDAAEGVVGGDALGDVEVIVGGVAGVVEGEEAGGDDGVGEAGVDAETGGEGGS